MESYCSPAIAWRDWSDEAFEEAEKEDKLILLNISAPWCHWCHVMERTTYSNPHVIRIINERFIPIKVNADKRPDIQDKYLLGGWPTTAFLLPDGRILTGATFMPPGAMLNKLPEVDTLYREQKALVTMHVTSAAAEAEYERAQAEEAAGRLEPTAIEVIMSAVKKSFDPVYGGFGHEPKFPHPNAVQFAILRYKKTGDTEALNIARRTLDAMMNLRDPVWGGFYRYASSRDWSRPHYEKMLYVQAETIESYLDMYEAVGEDQYAAVALEVKRYVDRFLSDRENGGFYGSQDADLGGGDPNVEFITGEEYYARSEQERLVFGIPAVDKTIYTDWNGAMAVAFLRMSEVLGNTDARDFALKTIARILHECSSERCLYHYCGGGPEVLGFLADQVGFGRALLAAYRITREPEYLREAEKLVCFMATELQDVVDGGFYQAPFNPRAKGQLAERHKPLEQNMAAARFLTEFCCISGNETCRELAQRTLSSIPYPQIKDNVIGAGYALALSLYLDLGAPSETHSQS